MPRLQSNRLFEKRGSLSEPAGPRQKLAQDE